MAIDPEKAELVAIRMANAKKTMSEVDILLANRLWNTAVNRLYYACFYAVTALLHNEGMDTKTHSGATTLFSLHFIKTNIISDGLGEFYTDLFSMRQGADYADMINYDESDVIKLVIPAHKLISAIEEVLNRP